MLRFVAGLIMGFILTLSFVIHIQAGYMPYFKGLIEGCEQSLPRDEHCEISWEAKKVIKES